MRRATEADREFIQNPNAWPNWPILPMKRANEGEPGAFPICGFIRLGVNTTIHLGSIHDNIDSNQVEKKEYSSLDELFDDGWVVD